MYRVLLAEDEPAALRYLRTLIETHFPELSIVGTASDGRQALELAKSLAPQLVFTDVKMPLVDGIQLVRQLKTFSPTTPVVIVSGYDDFEYVRQALDTGVVDYVLKPVTAQKLSEVFAGLDGILRRNRDAETLSNVKQLVYGGRLAPGDSSMTATGFRLAVLRYGAPPSRFSHWLAITLTERCIDGWCAVRGRDGNELLFVAGADRLDANGFSNTCAAAVDEKVGVYHTLLRLPQVVPAGHLSDEVRALFEVLDHSIVLGRNRLLEQPGPKTTPAGLDHLDASRIEYAVINSNSTDLQELIRHQVSMWEQHMVPAIDVELGARRILETVQHVSVRSTENVDTGSVAEELLARAVSARDFGESFLRVALEVAHIGTGRQGAKESASLFAGIRSYLESSYSRQHTVDSVRSQFRISASYLSKLLRANTGQSFTGYLRQLRVSAAQRLIQDSPEMPMKSVARYVGFADPFYFSRVFRSVTGETPSEYSRRCRSD